MVSLVTFKYVVPLKLKVVAQLRGRRASYFRQELGQTSPEIKIRQSVQLVLNSLEGLFAFIDLYHFDLSR